MSGPKNFEGQAVSRSFTPDYIFLSYLVSYIGAWTTLELLQRRTAGRGLYNWCEQALPPITVSVASEAPSYQCSWAC